MIPWSTITSIGDLKAMAPAAATIAIGLAMGNAWRMALWWCILLASGLCMVIASKVAFIGWCIGSPTHDFTGFSGHAMRAMAIIPVLFYLALQNTTRSTRTFGVLLGIMFGALVGISRLILHNHSVTEVVTGAMLGLLISLGFIYALSTSHKFKLNRVLVTLCLMAILLAPYAEPAPTQRWLTDFSLYLSGHDQPCVRAVR